MFICMDSRLTLIDRETFSIVSIVCGTNRTLRTTKRVKSCLLVHPSIQKDRHPYRHVMKTRLHAKTGRNTALVLINIPCKVCIPTNPSRFFCWQQPTTIRDCEEKSVRHYYCFHCLIFVSICVYNHHMT